METKIFTQKGTLVLYLFVPTLLFLVAIVAFIGLSGPPFYIILFVALLLTGCMLTFYKLTINITNEAVSFAFGTGWFKKRYLLSEIKSCKAVKNPLIYGIGIRLIPNGMLYNIAGNEAVELQFKNRKSVVRIGTNKPNEVCHEIMQYLQPAETSETYTEKTKHKNYYLLVITIIFIVAVVFPAGLIIYGSKDTRATIENNNLNIKGMYGMDIALSDITKADTIAQLPPIQMRTNGYAAGNSKIGHFRLTNGQRVKLFVKAASPPFIHIIAKDSSHIYLNFNNPAQTRIFYNKLIGSH